MATLELRNKFKVKHGTIGIRYALIVSGEIRINTYFVRVSMGTTAMTRIRLTSTLLMTIALAACGGGGGGGSGVNATVSSDPAEGLWQGTIQGGANITGLVLNDGTYYVLYSPANNRNVIAGLVQGSGTGRNGSFSSSNARDFVIGDDVYPATVSASYSSKQSFNGSVTYTNGRVASFTSTYDSTYEQPASLTAAAGNYSGESASSVGVQASTVAIQSNGSFQGSSNGCNVSGALTPRGSSSVFNMAVTFGGGACIFGTSTLNGIAIYDAANKRLYAAAPNSSRTDGFLFVGTKP